MTQDVPTFLCMIAAEQYETAREYLARYVQSISSTPEATATALRHLMVALHDAQAHRARYQSELAQLEEVRQFLGPRRHNVTVEEFG